MDPRTITTTVLSITARCLTTAKTLYTLRGKYQAANLTITAIYSETTVIGVSLSKIQNLVLLHSSSPTSIASNIQAKPEVETAFDTALTGCMLVYSVLEQEVQRLNNVESGVWGGVKVMWNEDGMREMLQQIRGQQIALSLLIQMLDMETVSEIRSLMQANSKVLSKVSLDVQNLRRSHPRVRAPSSIFDMPTIDTESIVSSTMFAFDDAVVSSTAYRRAVANADRLRPVIERSDSSTTDDDPDRSEALRSLLREREDENLQLRAQVSKLTRANVELQRNWDDKHQESIDSDVRLKELTNSLEDRDKVIKKQGEQMEKIIQKNSKLEKALAKSRKPMLAQMRDLIDRGKESTSQSVWIYGGLSQDAVISKAEVSRLLNEDMTMIIVNEETEIFTRINIQRKLDAIRQLVPPRPEPSTAHPEKREQEEQPTFGLVIGGHSLVHSQNPDIQDLFAELVTFCSVVILWHEGPLLMTLEDFRDRVKVHSSVKIAPTGMAIQLRSKFESETISKHRVQAETGFFARVT